MSRSSFVRLAAAALLALAAIVPAQAQDAAKVLRIVPQTDLKILDPIWTTAFVTRDHGYMIYDTLFGVDANGKPQPQMVEQYTASPNAKLWTFTLRKGLAFHDGKPVTSADVIASLERWGKRDSLGQKMFAALDKIEATGDNGWKMSFREPFGLVLEALSKPSGSPAFIMPKRVADTPADKQIDDYTGSGPYVFKKDEFRPGEKVVYLKNAAYQPRAEPPSGTAGGKRVYVDRVEWMILKDAQTQASAITNGEVDMLTWLPAEHYASLRTNPKLEMVNPTLPGSYFLHLNHHIPPFDNPKIARAALLAVNQEALLRAQLVFRDLYHTCTSIYPCASPLASAEDGLLHRQAAVRGGEEAAQGGGLRRQAGGADAPGRLRAAQQAAAGAGAAAQAGRLQGRHAVDGLADAADAPRQEGSGRQGRLEPVHDRLGRERHDGSRCSSRRSPATARRAGSAGPRTTSSSS